MNYPSKRDITRNFVMAAPSVAVGDPTAADGALMYDFGVIPQAIIRLTLSKAMGSDVGGHQEADHLYSRGIRAEVELTINDWQHASYEALISDAQRQATAETLTGVDTTAGTFAVGVDLTTDDQITVGDSIAVVDSTGNDGAYTVTAVSWDSTGSTTTITVMETITDPTVDGDLIWWTDGLLFNTGFKQLTAPTLCVIPNGDEDGAIDEACWWIPRVTDTDIGDQDYSDSEGEDANSEISVTLKALLANTDHAGIVMPEGAKKIFKMSPKNVGSGALSGWTLPPAYD